jgi:hypothetical protein
MKSYDYGSRECRSPMNWTDTSRPSWHNCSCGRTTAKNFTRYHSIIETNPNVDPQSTSWRSIWFISRNAHMFTDHHLEQLLYFLHVNTRFYHLIFCANWRRRISRILKSSKIRRVTFSTYFLTINHKVNLMHNFFHRVYACMYLYSYLPICVCQYMYIGKEFQFLFLLSNIWQPVTNSRFPTAQTRVHLRTTWTCATSWRQQHSLKQIFHP